MCPSLCKEDSLFLGCLGVSLAGDDKEGCSREVDVSAKLSLGHWELLTRKHLRGRLQIIHTYYIPL